MEIMKVGPDEFVTLMPGHEELSLLKEISFTVCGK